MINSWLPGFAVSGQNIICGTMRRGISQWQAHSRPFVNILGIADCLDAAVDNIGRPAGHMVRGRL